MVNKKDKRSREEQLRKKKEREKERRRKIKEDPIKLNEYREKTDWDI